jgi:NADPH2:quinone reductase
MKAVLCNAFGPPEHLQWQDRPPLSPSPFEILVSIKAAGLNYPDLLMIEGKYQRVLPPPFCPGMELAGIVTAVGPEVEGFLVGDRICAHVRMGGAFAEEAVLTPDYAVAHIPACVPFEHAAAFPLAYGTALEALKDRAALKPGETVLVLGAAGGVGLAAVQIAKLLGARVIACASTDERLAVCKSNGADEVVNYGELDVRDAVRQLTGNRGVDVVCDLIGGDRSERALRTMALNGRYCVIGFASGTIPRIPLNLVLLKGCAIVGVAIGMNAVRGNSDSYRANLMQLIRWIADGQLTPVVSRVYPMSETAQAMADLAARGTVGKVVLVQ